MALFGCELLDRQRFTTRAEARMAVFTFIEGFYNPRRRHSSLGYLSPVAYEQKAHDPDRCEPAAALAAIKERPESDEAIPVAAPRPSLTAATRDSQSAPRVGTEEWLRRAPNKRMPDNRRTKNNQTLYPDSQTINRPRNRGRSIMPITKQVVLTPDSISRSCSSNHVPAGAPVAGWDSHPQGERDFHGTRRDAG